MATKLATMLPQQALVMSAIKDTSTGTTQMEEAVGRTTVRDSVNSARAVVMQEDVTIDLMVIRMILQGNPLDVEQ